MIRIDLAEFVSDYLEMADGPVTSQEIAEAYLERTEAEGPVTAALLADVNYYRE